MTTRKRHDRPRLSRAATSRHLVRFAFLIGFAILALACAGGGSGPVLRVGVAPGDSPLVFESDGEIVGIEADLAYLIGQSLGRRIAFIRYDPQDLIGALERNDVDVVMSGLAITPTLEDRVRFCEPYMEVGQLTLIRSADLARFGRIQTIRRAGARVGYERGSRGEGYVAQSLTRSDSFGFDDLDSAIRSLRAGRIDYLIHDAPTIWRLAGDPEHRDLHGLYKPLTREHLAWAVHRNNVQLAALLDATLDHWKREGLIEPIVDRWIPVRITLP